MRWVVDASLKYLTKQDIPFEEKVKIIKSDIQNGPYHVFGDHSHCTSYFCKKNITENFVPELTAFGIFQKITDLSSKLSSHAYSFAYNASNNLAESLNARVAKLVGGNQVYQ